MRADHFQRKPSKTRKVRVPYQHQGEPGQGPTVPGTPATPQPKDPTEGGSVGPEIPGVPLGAPQKNPDPGLEQHPHKAPALPPVVPDQEIVP